MRMRSKLLIVGALIAGILGAARADVNYTQGSGSVIFAFTCFTTKICPAHTLVNSAGSEIGTSGAPVRTDPTGTTTQPASIVQGGNTATVKAASTAPVAGDPGVVVSLSPNVGGITPVVSSALESNHVIKAGAGVLISGYVTTGAVQGWLLVANSTTAPTAGGAAIAPIACVYAPANATTSIGGQGGPSIIASTGITLVFSTSGCLTNTASSTAFFSGQAL